LKNIVETKTKGLEILKILGIQTCTKHWEKLIKLFNVSKLAHQRVFLIGFFKCLFGAHQLP
jgi:hypothetical protein